MALTNPCLQYRQAQVATAGPGRLVVMLYDGAINFLKQAIQARKNGQEKEARQLLRRAQDIVFELWGTLDLQAGEVAGNLFRLYEYINGRLVVAAISRDTAPLVEAADLLSGLREAWQAVAQSNVAKQDSTMDLERSGTLG